MTEFGSDIKKTPKTFRDVSSNFPYCMIVQHAVTHFDD